MLDAYSVPVIFLGLAVLSFPFGFIITSTVKKEINFSLPFFAMLPTYLAVGISTIVLISTAIPSLLVSPYVLIIAAIIGYIFVIRIFNSTRVFKKRYHDVLKRLINFFKVELLGNGERTFPNIFSLCIVAALFAFVMTIIVGYPWPPDGNALLDSYLTSLTVDRSFVINDLTSSTIPFAYPVGYDLLSANISVLFNIYPAEAVFIFAAFIIFVISCLLFSLTFILTRSLWISLPAALVIFSIFGLLGPVNSGDGLISTLPYPAIFGLLSVIMLIFCLQLIQSYHSNPSIWKSLPLVTISLLSVYIIFPRFLTLEAIIILSYYTLILYKQSVFERKRTGERRSYFTDYFRPTHSKHDKKSRKEIGTTESSEPTTTKTSLAQRTYMQNSRDRQALSNSVLSLLIIVGFTVPFLIFGLGGYYFKISIFSDPVYFEGTNIISNFSHSIIQPWEVLDSNIYLAAFIIVALGTSVLTIVVTFKAIPLLIVCIVLFASFVLSGFYLTSTILTAGLMGSLSFTIIAFSIWQIFEIKDWIKSKRKMIFATVIFVSVALLIQIPPITNNAVGDEGEAYSLFGQFYEIGRWLDASDSKADRILNDWSLAGYYMDGFSVKNLTYNYPSDFTIPELKSNVQESNKELRMIQELNVVVWQNPDEPELIYPLLNYYNISYIVLLPQSESGFEGGERYGKRPFDNEIYAKYFDSYDFLQANLSDSSSRIYRVK
jgi:hypothetical protein